MSASGIVYNIHWLWATRQVPHYLQDCNADKEKKVKERIVLREIHLRTTRRHLSMGSHSVICLHPNRAGWYSIYRPRKDERLSWPGWLVTYRNGLPVHTVTHPGTNRV